MKRSKILQLIALLTVCVFSVLATACNTVEGAGEDIEATGEAIEDAAD